MIIRGKTNYILAIGQLSLVLGILGFIINYLFINNNPVLIFFISIFFGLSLVMNLTYLLKRKKQ